ncbi:hypothetical protein E2C01_061014 [Portunus trituberculatus]|uniref:Uncharacterized protein n=1 Tax=Portunus trituberculatus TaxID=210409 RepID=A0A5B7HAL5_PORTR|nr:hypothetical protein [Portunus trituberculatus]
MALVREASLYRYPDTRDKRGQVTSTLGLRWRSPDTFRDPLARVTCRATIPGGHVTSESEVIYLDTASSVTYHHRYSSKGEVPECDGWMEREVGKRIYGGREGGREGGERDRWMHG